MSELEKPFRKNQIRKTKKTKENQSQNAASKNFKFGSNKKQGVECTMNGLGKPLEKNLIRKLETTVKTKVKLPHVNKKKH